jgi:hypothetical protein
LGIVTTVQAWPSICSVSVIVHGVGDDQVDGIVCQQQWQLRRTTGIPLGQRQADLLVSEELVERERALHGFVQHLARHVAHRSAERCAIGGDSRVVAVDPQPVRPLEGHAKRDRLIHLGAFAGVADANAGVVGICRCLAVCAAHLVEQAAGIGAAAGQRHRREENNKGGETPCQR